MSLNDNKVVDLIKKYCELFDSNPNEAVEISKQFLSILLQYDVKENFPRACIRYLFSTKKWMFNATCENKEQWKNLLEKFFAVDTGGSEYISDNYLDETKKIIMDNFDYEPIVPVNIVPNKPPKKEKPKKKRKSKKDFGEITTYVDERQKNPSSNEEGESGSKIFKSIAEALSEKIKKIS